MPTPWRSAMREDRVEMAAEIAVDADRIEAAHQVGALHDRLVEQLGGAGRAGDAALREGDDLDRDQVAEALAHLQDGVQVLEAELGCRCRRGCACAACRWPRPASRDWRRSRSRRRRARRAPCARPRCDRRRCCRPPGWAPTAGRAASCRDGYGRRPAAAAAARPARDVVGGRSAAMRPSVDLDVVPAAVGQRGVADHPSRSSAARPWSRRGSSW